MSGRFGFWEILSLAAAVQGIFLAAVIWTHRRGNRRANRLLAALVFLFSLQLLEIVLYWTRSLQEWPHLWGVSWFFPFLYGVLLYFYSRALGGPEKRLALRHAWHLTPFALGVLAFSNFYAQSAEMKARQVVYSYPSQESGGDVNFLVLSIWILQFVHFSGYMAWSARRLRAAAGDPSRYSWLRRLLIAFGLSFACWFVNGLAVGLGVPYHGVIDYGATFAMAATIYGIGYTALRQPELFLGPLRKRPAAKYEKSTLTPREAKRCERRLIEEMQSAKPYREPDLRLNDLARDIEAHPHHLSQVINQRFKRNFNDFVNLYRVEEAKRLMADPARRDETLLDLAFEAGFNNKTSFNQAFKKHTGMTPSRFRDAQASRRDGEARRREPVSG